MFCLGLLGGTVAFIIVEGALIGIDYIVPNEEYDASGKIVR